MLLVIRLITYSAVTPSAFIAYVVEESNKKEHFTKERHNKDNASLAVINKNVFNRSLFAGTKSLMMNVRTEPE